MGAIADFEYSLISPALIPEISIVIVASLRAAEEGLNEVKKIYDTKIDPTTTPVITPVLYILR
jgi:hypothetical protein